MSLEFQREIRNRDTDLGIILREEAGKLKRVLIKRTELEGIASRSSKERGTVGGNQE